MKTWNLAALGALAVGGACAALAVLLPDASAPRRGELAV
jgi:hypothetical protein